MTCKAGGESPSTSISIAALGEQKQTMDCFHSTERDRGKIQRALDPAGGNRGFVQAVLEEYAASLPSVVKVLPIGTRCDART